jgi:hypothetical protein
MEPASPSRCVFSRVDSLQFWRTAHALSSAHEHAGLTREQAVAKAVARVDGYFDRRARTADGAGARLAAVRAERASGFVRWWCRSCDHSVVELLQRKGTKGAEGERFCLAVTEGTNSAWR